MQKRKQLTKARSSRQLLKTLTDNPGLPAFVPTLQAPVLKRLIEHVGLHDAGDLIALTTPQQMREIFEESLWEALIPGQAERLRPERFLEWLDVMLEAGAAFAAQRLIELGDAFVALHFAPLLTVVDATVLSEHQEDACMCAMCMLSARDASFEVIGDYLVVGLHDDEWDTVRAALVEIDGEDAAFLQRVLAQCSTAPTMRDFNPDGGMLEDDETYEREQRRERSGFMTPQMAAVFLKSARQASREDLFASVGYDTISQRYFNQLATAAASAAEQRRQITEHDDGGSAQMTITPVQLRALETALVDAQIVGDRSPALLSGPQNAREPTLALQARLDRLQLTHPTVFAARLGELIFLANVLMSGSWYQGGRFSETEAAAAALACANLGLDQLLTEHGMTRAEERALLIESILDEPPGIVRLFQIGWNLIQALPLRAARALLEALRADHVREQLQRKRWILDEIESAVSDPDMLDLIAQGEFEDVGDNLVLLTLVLDPRACQCLRTLITDFPRYPLQLNVGLERAQTNESQYLATIAQLGKVDAFLEQMDQLLKI
jgi:hypothetical protein